MEQPAALTPKFNAKRYLWLKGRLRPDLLDLDEEISRISVLVQDANENASVANEIRDSTKEQVNVAAARASARLREELLPSGKPRSETQIASELPLCPEYQDALNAASEARLDAALWNSMASGYSTKAYSLSTATELIKMGYITKDAIIEKRRADIRGAASPAILPRPTTQTT